MASAATESTGPRSTLRPRQSTAQTAATPVRLVRALTVTVVIWQPSPAAAGDPNNASSLAPCTTDADSTIPSESCGTSCLKQWPPPDGFINFQDINAAVFTFSGLPTVTATDVKNLDIHGNDGGDANEDPPNYIVNFDDIGLLAKAFEGWPYPYSDPGDCPDVGAWP